MRKFFIAAGILLSVYSCSEKLRAKQNHPLLEEMNWLIGTWKNVSADGVFYEIWNTFHDSAFTGIGFMLVKGDTLFSEIISLESRNGELYYIPTVREQNNGKSVLFKLTSHTNREYIFENKSHDFPQRIIYVNTTPDSLYARVEGMQEAEFRKEEFAMSREK